MYSSRDPQALLATPSGSAPFQQMSLFLPVTGFEPKNLLLLLLVRTSA